MREKERKREEEKRKLSQKIKRKNVDSSLSLHFLLQGLYL